MKTSKLIITTLIAITSLSLLLAGCGQDDSEITAPPSNIPGASTESTSPAPSNGITVNKIEFEEITEDDLDVEMANLINDMALEGGFYYWVDSEGTYTVFIGLGERPTSGYEIKVLSVEDNEGKTNITVEETKPAEDDMVAQVITYPYTVVQMKGITNNFNITDTKGTEFAAIELENLARHMVVCIYQGLIDNTSIETTLDGEPVVFRNNQMASKVDGIDEGTLVTIIYTTNDEGQMILESIVEVEVDSETIDATGIYQGLIDGNSIEVLVDGVYMALRNTEVETMTEGLKKDDSVEIKYTVSSEDQFLLISIGPSK
ncbi:MAG: protease complex subunit PrcB family protein [Clostridia bacterium]|nr:protease complex subunit PrcB family protein [Clostridia bacterium]MBN2883572.1 protease complex subunit PrcB family protein [Clostridia bacterium]